MLGWGGKRWCMIPEFIIFSHVICGLLVWLLENKGYTVKMRTSAVERFSCQHGRCKDPTFPLVFQLKESCPVLGDFTEVSFVSICCERRRSALHLHSRPKKSNINIHFASTKWMFLRTFNQALRVQGTYEHMTQQSKQKTQSTSLGCVDINTTHNLRFHSFYNCCNSTKYQSSQADTC